MWGAIIGDLAGSIYEFQQTKGIKKIEIKELIAENSFYSDDTILTIAILDAILNNQNYEQYLKYYINKYKDYKPNFSPYFKAAFSPSLLKWANSNIGGTSTGNGSMMRISPVGYLFNNLDEVLKQTKLATIPSHNSKEAISCATIIALIIYYARRNYPKEKIIETLKLNYTYKPFLKFNVTCKETIDNCLYALFSSDSFEEALTKVISYGGDTDTNACIVGSMAESLYGIDNDLIIKAKHKLPNEFIIKLDEGYKRIRKN